VTHRIAVVGAWLFQEFVEVIVPRRTLIFAVSRRNLAGGGWPAILLVFPIIADCRWPVGVVSFRLGRGLVSLEDSPDFLLAGGVVGGDVQELMCGARLLAPQFVDPGFAARLAEKRTDDIVVDDAGE
jgi:hypothetical protein